MNLNKMELHTQHSLNVIFHCILNCYITHSVHCYIIFKISMAACIRVYCFCIVTAKEGQKKETTEKVTISITSEVIVVTKIPIGSSNKHQLSNHHPRSLLQLPSHLLNHDPSLPRHLQNVPRLQQNHHRIVTSSKC